MKTCCDDFVSSEPKTRRSISTSSVSSRTSLSSRGSSRSTTSSSNSRSSSSCSTGCSSGYSSGGVSEMSNIDPELQTLQQRLMLPSGAQVNKHPQL